MKNSDFTDSGVLHELGRGLQLFWEALVEGLQLRCELFGLELREVSSRYLFLLLLAAIALFTTFMAFLCLNVLVFSVFWEDRVMISLGLFGFYFLVALGLTLVTMRKIKTAPGPFVAFAKVIKQDQAVLVSDFEN